MGSVTRWRYRPKPFIRRLMSDGMWFVRTLRGSHSSAVSVWGNCHEPTSLINHRYWLWFTCFFVVFFCFFFCVCVFFFFFFFFFFFWVGAGGGGGGGGEGGGEGGVVVFFLCKPNSDFVFLHFTPFEPRVNIWCQLQLNFNGSTSLGPWKFVRVYVVRASWRQVRKQMVIVYGNVFDLQQIIVCCVYSLESPLMSTHNIQSHNKMRKFLTIFVFLSYRKNSVETQNWVRISHGKRAIEPLKFDCKSMYTRGVLQLTLHKTVVLELFVLCRTL